MAAAVTEGDPAASADLLRPVVALKGELDAVAVLVTDGTPLASLGSAGTPSGMTFDASSSFIAAALASEDGNKHAGFVATGASTMLAIAAPICSGTDPCAPVGAAVVAQDLSDVLEGLAAGDLAARLDGGGLTLFDEAGRPLAATGTTPSVAEDTGPEPDRLVRVVGEVSGSEVHTLYAPYGLQGEARGTVAVTLSAESAFADLRGTGLRLTLVLLLALVGIVAVGALVSRGILRQVRPLVEANKRLGSGDLTARVPIVSGDEIGEVASGLNQMAEQLQASYATLESRVEQRTAEVERLLRQRTEFFASLSHELRTPLAIILSQSDLLLLEADEGEVADTGRAIRQSAAQLLGVVSEILELARAESGTLEVEPEPVALAEFVADLHPTLAGLTRAGEIDLTVDIGEDLPVVAADRERLREIVINLVDNAVKYSPPGSEVRVTAEAEEDHVAVLVADAGLGIPDGVGDQLFEPFFRVQRTAPRTGQASTGLGLALTRRLVEAHGGEITYDSTLGAGTTFRFTLPIAVAGAASGVASNGAVHRTRARR
ncbi:MAG: HAMP domain-containing histidine kinase [Actinobacteria bacterium]|nr:HAMP domain-containing histidine kinase [Actinomycetota bacterium]